MRWLKKGLIFCPNANYKWMQQYAWVPTVDHLEKDLYRIYFATRNQSNLSQIGYIIIDLNTPKEILEISSNPVLKLGKLGCFDDSAVIPTWVIHHQNLIYLYYIGWVQGKTVPFYANLGLAISHNNGRTFRRYSQAPILDRNPIDPYMTASACILIERNLWRMWYLSGLNWRLIKGKPQSFYHIKYAQSNDGINWHRTGVVCIDFKNNRETRIARPCVIEENGMYKMWYSYASENYRIGFAQSKDGINWTRKDKLAGISVSKSGWDSQMVEYAFIFNHKNNRYMVYNGNEYGKTGFGLAVLDKS